MTAVRSEKVEDPLLSGTQRSEMMDKWTKAALPVLLKPLFTSIRIPYLPSHPSSNISLSVSLSHVPEDEVNGQEIHFHSLVALTSVGTLKTLNGFSLAVCSSGLV